MKREHYEFFENGCGGGLSLASGLSPSASIFVMLPHETTMTKNIVPLPANCVTAVFQKREKRFIIKATVDNKPVAAHTNNSGSMLGLLKTGREILLSAADNPRRKLPYTLELIRLDDFWVGVNTMTPNKMLKLAWKYSLIPELAGFDEFKSEVVYGQSRLDACLQGLSGPMWIEAKNVTLVEDERACFPDAVSQRAARHMEELADLSRQGKRTACFYLVQRPDCKCFGPADFIDPHFAKAFQQAAESGLEILAYKADITERGVKLGTRLPIFWG